MFNIWALKTEDYAIQVVSRAGTRIAIGGHDCLIPSVSDTPEILVDSGMLRQDFDRKRAQSIAKIVEGLLPQILGL